MFISFYEASLFSGKEAAHTADLAIILMPGLSWGERGGLGIFSFLGGERGFGGGKSPFLFPHIYDICT